jgi:hypothetical protein
VSLGPARIAEIPRQDFRNAPISDGDLNGEEPLTETDLKQTNLVDRFPFVRHQEVVASGSLAWVSGGGRDWPHKTIIPKILQFIYTTFQ